MTQLSRPQGSLLLMPHLKNLPLLKQTAQMEEIQLVARHCQGIAEDYKGQKVNYILTKKGDMQAEASFILRLFSGAFFFLDFGFTWSCFSFC